MKQLLERISPGYLAQQIELHSRPGGYGEKGHKWADTVHALVLQYHASSVLDYGCGRGSLVHNLGQRTLGGVRLSEYDPAVKGKDAPPLFADLVVVTDVLEHIEPERLEAVLAHVHMLARRAVFFVVAIVPANKILNDGRNAHLILESPEWWHETVTAAGFRLHSADGLPRHKKFNPIESQKKRWVAIGEPC